MRSICMMLQKSNNLLKRITRPLIRWPFGCLILLFAMCRNNDNYHTFTPTRQDSLKQLVVLKKALLQIHDIKSQITDGDLITRTGNDFTSETLRNLNQRDRTFSHCGIASIENDSLFVYHALGGDFNPDQKIRRDRFEDFAEPYTNKGIGVFRFEMTDSSKKKFAINARGFYNTGIMFDMDFDLKTNDRMYCAEYVYKSLTKNAPGLVFNISRIRHFEFIGVDDLFLHPLCKLNAHLVYK